jgi:Ca2+-binding EF-hand superfamily protein
LAHTFKKFDTNGNGTLTKEELRQGYLELYKESLKKKEIEHEVDMIWSKLDIDGLGTVDYTEWAMGTCNKMNTVTK